MENQNNQVDYNAEPVFYCTRCLSLKVMNESHLPDLEYCGDCGSTNIETTDIKTWELMFEQRYGLKLLDR